MTMQSIKEVSLGFFRREIPDQLGLGASFRRRSIAAR
jgi:hypothetical protein